MTMVLDCYVKHAFFFGLVTVSVGIGPEYNIDSSLKMCRTGYHGNSCFEICPYPTFGKMCKGICKCIPHLCNHIHGCPTIGTNCPLGFIGNFCQIPCQYPQYGIACQQICFCSKTNCNSSTGCPSPKKNIIYFDRDSQKRNNNTTTQKKGSSMSLIGISEIQTKNEATYLLNKDYGFSKEPKTNFRREKSTLKEDSVNFGTESSQKCVIHRNTQKVIRIL